MPQATSIRTTDPDTIEAVEALQAEEPGRYASLSKALDRIVRDWQIARAKTRSQAQPLGQHLDVTA